MEFSRYTFSNTVDGGTDIMQLALKPQVEAENLSSVWQAKSNCFLFLFLIKRKMFTSVG